MCRGNHTQSYVHVRGDGEDKLHDNRKITLQPASVAGPVADKTEEFQIAAAVSLLLCILLLPWAHEETVQIKEQANVQCCNKVLNKI